jgi:hypothetical protein
VLIPLALELGKRRTKMIEEVDKEPHAGTASG